MSCQFCNHPTPHSCWDAAEAASCGNYANARAAMKAQHGGVVAVEREIQRLERIMKPPTPKQIEKRERAELARLKSKYEK